MDQTFINIMDVRGASQPIRPLPRSMHVSELSEEGGPGNVYEGKASTIGCSLTHFYSTPISMPITVPKHAV